MIDRFYLTKAEFSFVGIILFLIFILSISIMLDSFYNLFMGSKRKYLLLKLFSSLAAASLLVSIGFWFMKDYHVDTMRYTEISENGVLRYSKNLSEARLKRAEEVFSLVPEQQKVFLRDSGFVIYIIDPDHDNTRQGKRSGLYHRLGDEAFVQTGGIYDRWFTRTLLHEVGHRLDYSAKGRPLSSDPKWEELCDSYRISGKNFVTLQDKLNEDDGEAFAEAFSFSCWCPKEFSAQCPDLYEYVLKTTEKPS